MFLQNNRLPNIFGKQIDSIKSQIAPLVSPDKLFEFEKEQIKSHDHSQQLQQLMDESKIRTRINSYSAKENLVTNHKRNVTLDDQIQFNIPEHNVNNQKRFFSSKQTKTKMS